MIAAIAIPLSAVPTFWFMELLGFTLNQLSLLALSLVAVTAGYALSRT